MSGRPLSVVDFNGIGVPVARALGARHHANKTPAAAGHGNDGQPVNEQAKAITMVSTGNTTICEAGHALPCPICGATDERDCNGGQYVSPALRRPLRTKERARRDIINTRRQTRITEQEREARYGNR